MNAREAILKQLRQSGQRETPPAAWRSRRHFPDLGDRFAAALAAAKGEVHQAGGLQEALNEIGRLLDEMGARRVVANDEFPLSALDLPDRWPDIEWHVVGQSEGDLRAFCVDADVGLSSADAALAETGSLVISSGPGKSRLATLLPMVHLALVPTSRLTADIFTWTAARQEAIPANVTLVSGPSKTADIEQTMAVGVHGPKRFIVILYED